MEGYFSKVGRLVRSDVVKGFVVAVLTAPMTVAYQSLTSVPPNLVLDWKTLGATAAAGGIGYILKNLLTGENGKLLTNK